MAPLAHTLALLAMTVATAAIEVLPVDMAQNSFDDQYRNCGRAMTKALPALKDSELQQNPLFAKVWAEATAEWQKRGSRVSPLSSSDQAIALMAYTMDDERLYKDFNKAVRKAGSSRQEYQDKFHYKSLHFLLTQALATLRVSQRQKCRNAIMSVSNVQFQARRGDIVRFGQFVLMRPDGVYFTLEIKTVLEVHTCHGAEIHKLPEYPGRKQVLIPPFETFKVIDVSPNGARIQLRSTGTHSNYNCEWLGGDVTEETTWDDTDTDYEDDFIDETTWEDTDTDYEDDLIDETTWEDTDTDYEDDIIEETTWEDTDTDYEHEDTRGGSVPMVPFHLGWLLLTTTALAVATGIL